MTEIEACLFLNYHPQLNAIPTKIHMNNQTHRWIGLPEAYPFLRTRASFIRYHLSHGVLLDFDKDSNVCYDFLKMIMRIIHKYTNEWE